MYHSVTLFLVSAVFVAHIRATGWSFLWGHIIFLWGGIIFAWQLDHSWVGLTEEFFQEILNCLYGMLVGLHLGAQYAKGE
jgi:hypothetical protein